MSTMKREMREIEPWDRLTYIQYAELFKSAIGNALKGKSKSVLGKYEKKDLYQECVRIGLLDDELGLSQLDIQPIIIKEEDLTIIDNPEADSLDLEDTQKMVANLRESIDNPEVSDQSFFNNISLLLRQSVFNAVSIFNAAINGEIKINRKNLSHINLCAKILKPYLPKAEKKSKKVIKSVMKEVTENKIFPS